MYLDKEKQKELVKIMEEYLEITNDGQHISPKSERLMNDFFIKYVDKIIMGIIYAPSYKFFMFAELDDLLQEGRMAIISSVHKRQWDEKKGTIFNFFSTVIARNLINYTTKLNRHSKSKSQTDISKLFNNPSLTYNHDYERLFILEDLRGLLKKHFSGKKKLVNLSDLLIQYHYSHMSTKFIKKNFIRYAKAYNYSPAMVNTFFDFIKRLKNKKEVKDFIEMIGDEL